jgi:hypothetical protein
MSGALQEGAKKKKKSGHEGWAMSCAMPKQATGLASIITIHA